MFIIAFSVQVWHITLARACEGTAFALLWLSVQAITADVADADDRGRSFGSIPQATYRGAIIGTFIGFGVLASLGIRSGWRPLFLGYATTCLIAAVLALLHIPETNPTFSSQVERRPLPRSRPWVLLLLVTAVTGASWAMITPILMIFLQEKLTTDVASLGTAYLPAALIWAALPSRLGALADRFGRKPLMVLGLIAASSSSFYIPHLSSLLGLAMIWAFQALCHAAGDPAEEALVADLTGGDQRGRAYGMYTMAAGLGATLGPLVGGWLYEAIGSKAPFYANGIVLAMCAVILAALLKIPSQQRQAVK
jgi:MFS family permease